MRGAHTPALFNTPTAWRVTSPGSVLNTDTIKNTTPHSMYPYFSLHQLSQMLLSPNSLISSFTHCFYPPSSNHFLPSALFCYSKGSVVFSACSPLRLIPWSPLLRPPHSHQTEVKRSSSWIFWQLRFFPSPSNKPPTSLISGDQGRIYWDHLSNWGNGLWSAYWSPCCVHSLSLSLAHWAQITQTALQSFRDTKLYRSSLLLLTRNKDTRESEQWTNIRTFLPPCPNRHKTTMKYI